MKSLRRAGQSRQARSPSASGAGEARRGRLLSEMSQDELLEFKAKYGAAVVDEVIAAEEEMLQQDRAQCERLIQPLSRGQLRRVNEAMGISGTTAEQSEECQRLVGFAITDVEYFKRRADDPKRFDHVWEGRSISVDVRNKYLAKAERIRRAADALEQELFAPGMFVGTIFRARRAADYYQTIASTARVPKGGHAAVRSKERAADLAYILLTRFGKRRPGLTPNGRWHNLANALWGDDIDFDYLRREHKIKKSSSRGSN